MKIKKVNELYNKPKAELMPELVEDLRILSSITLGAYRSIDKYRDNVSIERLTELRKQIQDQVDKTFKLMPDIPIRPLKNNNIN